MERKKNPKNKIKIERGKLGMMLKVKISIEVPNLIIFIFYFVLP